MAHRKYSDDKLDVLDTDVLRLTEYPVSIDSNPRTYSGADKDGGPVLNGLATRSLAGDWCWKPDRDKYAGVGDDYPTLRNPMPRSAVEDAAMQRYLKGEIAR